MVLRWLMRVIGTALLVVALVQCSRSVAEESVTPINNREYARTVMKLIREANSNIKLLLYQARFYEEYPDSESNHLLEALLDAKKRGVSVVAVLDLSDWNEENIRYNTDFGKRLAAGGIEVYFDNPKVVSHEKVILIDDAISVVSSTNWSHYSITRNNEVAVTIWSRRVNQALTHYFNQMMAQATRYLAEPSIPGLALARGFSSLPVEQIEILADRDYFPAVQRAFRAARKRIDVVQLEAMYYMVRPAYATEPQKVGETASLTNVLLRDLAEAKARGVEVRVILDVQDNRPNRNLDFANRLLAYSVPVYFDSPEVQSHCKLILVDDDVTILGSTNWSYNALQEGNEVSVLIRSRPVVQQYRNYFEEILETAAPVVAGVDFITTPGLHSQD